MFLLDDGCELISKAHADLLTRAHDLAPGLYDIPDRLDRDVADRKLATLGVDIDEVTRSQREYASDWRHVIEVNCQRHSSASGA